MGEPVRHRTCEITKQYKPVYEGYIFFKDKILCHIRAR